MICHYVQYIYSFTSPFTNKIVRIKLISFTMIPLSIVNVVRVTKLKKYHLVRTVRANPCGYRHDASINGSDDENLLTILYMPCRTQAELSELSEAALLGDFDTACDLSGPLNQFAS